MFQVLGVSHARHHPSSVGAVMGFAQDDIRPGISQSHLFYRGVRNRSVGFRNSVLHPLRRLVLGPDGLSHSLRSRRCGPQRNRLPTPRPYLRRVIRRHSRSTHRSYLAFRPDRCVVQPAPRDYPLDFLRRHHSVPQHPRVGEDLVILP